MFFIDVYGAIHNILKFIFIPWFDYDKKMYEIVRNAFTSIYTGFVVYGYIAININFKYFQELDIFIANGSIYLSLFVFIAAILLDYSVFYACGMDKKFLTRFEKASAYYKAIVYIISSVILLLPVLQMLAG